MPDARIAAPSVVGEWSNPVGWHLELRNDGTATWTIDMPDGQIISDVTYAVDLTQEPHHFDLGPFDEGMLDGMTLYGIIEFTDRDTFRWDCEPAPTFDDGQAARPESFDEQEVRVMVRE